MGYTPRYDKGDWIADCDVCGRKYKASTLQQRWDGLMCCPDDWEIRQPQDFVRGVPDTQIAPWLRPEPPDAFIPVTTVQWLVSWVTSNVSIFTLKLKALLVLTYNSVTTSILTKYRTFTNKAINGSVINKNTLG